MSKKTYSTNASIELPTGKPLSITGVKSLNGTDLFDITYDGKRGFVPRGLFVSRKPEAREVLHKQGVLVTSSADWNAIVHGIESIGTFESAPLLETPGWTKGYFAQKNGKVFSPGGAPKGRAIFDYERSTAPAQGSHRAWLSEVAQPLTGQHLPIIAVLAALAAPFLEFSGETQNFGLEFCGPPGTGKTTCLQLMASMVGSPTRIPTFNATRAGLETMFPEYRDLPFPVDEANLVDDRDRNALKDFAFRMANGTVKITAFQPDRAQYRFIFATTANLPFHETLRDFNADTAGAALQRLLPIKISNENGLGVFEFIPTGFPSSGAFAGHLRDAMHRLYGRPMQKLLRALVATRARDSKRFNEELLSHVRRFEAEVGISETRLGRSRASSAFGLLYAAGSFAKAKGIIPTSWDCLNACLAGYRNYQAQLPEQTPLIARLVTIATLSSTLDLREKPHPRLSDGEVEAHGAFLQLGRGKRVELLMTEQLRLRYFPDWAALRSTVEFLERNLRDAEHITKQRQVRQGHRKERFTCFVLPTDFATRLLR